MTECVNGCEFQEFVDGRFYCKMYEQTLDSEKSLDIENPDTIVIYRCEDCEKDGEIGTNTVNEKVRKIKQRIGWVMDSFYSFKDDLEEEITNIFRLLKELEENDES